MPNKSDHLTRFDVEGDVFQHRLMRIVAERHVVKPHFAGDVRHCLQCAIVDLFGLRIDYLKEAFRRCHGTRCPVDERTDVAQRFIKHRQITLKRYQRAECHRAAEDI